MLNQRFRIIIAALLGTALGAAPAWADGPTERVSVGVGGMQANASSYGPVLSRDGRFAAFWSNATNLAPNDDNGVGDVFVRDRKTSVTTLISRGMGDTPANGLSDLPVISGGGRFVAFNSRATNLALGDTTDATDVYVHDRRTQTTQLISANTMGVAVGGANPSISLDGRFVSFVTTAALVADDTNGALDVYVRDLRTGNTERVSVSSSGAQGNGNTYGISSLSGNGRFVAFASLASNLVPGDTTGGDVYDTFVHDRWTGKTERVSVGVGGAQANGSSSSGVFSFNGRFVAFSSEASNLVHGDTNGEADVFVYDRWRHATTRVSLSSNGQQGDNASNGALISGDGQLVGFTSWATNLVPNDTNNDIDVFVHDRRTGRTRLVSVNGNGGPSNGVSNSRGLAADGRSIAFASAADNLVPNDTNDSYDAFVRPLDPH